VSSLIAQVTVYYKFRQLISAVENLPISTIILPDANFSFPGMGDSCWDPNRKENSAICSHN
jgi:hypothetical protein